MMHVVYTYFNEFVRFSAVLWKSGRELKRQTVICVEPDHRKRSRTYDEEAKQKTRLLRLRVHLSGV
jgi:hypothetical protein